jgi:hypothetical protein
MPIGENKIRLTADSEMDFFDVMEQLRKRFYELIEDDWNEDEMIHNDSVSDAIDELLGELYPEEP